MALLVTLALRVLVVGAVVGLAFFVFGLQVVDEQLTRCFSAVALGEARNRAAFLDDVLERFRRVMAAWSYHRGSLPAPSDRAARA